MTNTATHPQESSAASFPHSESEMPRPTPQFRRHAWRQFQRALDPLARPKPLRVPRQLH